MNSFREYTRRLRTVEALAHITISVFGGAASTLGSAFFLFFCEITYLSKFGHFLFMTIGYSIFFALGLFPVLLLLIGPPFCRDKRSHICYWKNGNR